jgi:hypothetical protein
MIERLKNKLFKNKIMDKKFVIGDRAKNEWVKVLNTQKEQLDFTTSLAEALQYDAEEIAASELQILQETGFYTDLSVYYIQDNNAYIEGERDNYHPVNA